MIKLELNGLSPAAFPDPERRGGSGNIGTFSRACPNPEVVAKAKRRTFTAGYKERILAAADDLQQTGQIGALLRREGLYSSLFATWRKEGAAGITEVLSPHKRVSKSKQSPLASENAKLQRENVQLAERLRRAEIIIDVQKQLATLLGLPLRTPTNEELL